MKTRLTLGEELGGVAAPQLPYAVQSKRSKPITMLHERHGTT